MENTPMWVRQNEIDEFVPMGFSRKARERIVLISHRCLEIRHYGDFVMIN
jgi:hypothetical protein